ncbi:gluconeogenesis factor YvcK family protein [Allofustis seminis]|uniref:gluconeogenesis factor YvcK family protein n=1 Tax=Allofustis seminis TaxID=166939 RepID=UPI0003600C1A|nr:uridine diphosphate-N-acetylglucosamine-binding protein YvcK [Allofustis seminis]
MIKEYIPHSQRPKIAVIGGGTGLPVVLESLKNKNADITAIVTVADDGGSSGALRKLFNIVPPGDIRNVLVALSDLSKYQRDIFQYRFHSEDKSLDGHALGNLIILAASELQGSMYQAIQLLSAMMQVRGNVYPASDEPLILHAQYTDGTVGSGESRIARPDKIIERVTVSGATGTPHDIKAGRKVVSSIMNADLVVLGPGSLYTSILPTLMIPEIATAVCQTPARVLYIANIMTQMGETENFSDADHLRVLHRHLGKKFIDIALVNIGEVPEQFIMKADNEEYLYPVRHDFSGVKEEADLVISDNFLNVTKNGVYHDGKKVAEEIFTQVTSNIRRN